MSPYFDFITNLQKMSISNLSEPFFYEGIAKRIRTKMIIIIYISIDIRYNLNDARMGV